MSTYHDPTRGRVFSSLIASGEGSAKRQESYRLSQMPEVLSLLDYRLDTWLSQAELIKPNRRVVNLACIGLLFADLIPTASRGREGATLNNWLELCCPTTITKATVTLTSNFQRTWSPQAKWLLEDTLPKRALPRWNACQRYLLERLA